jgi:Permuted papain-like amidase enzyme, YaeF/YiiX, C92 family
MIQSRLLLMAGVCAAGVALLALPWPDGAVPAAPVAARAFAWNRDSLWRALERDFVQARASGCADTLNASRALTAMTTRVARINTAVLAVSSPALDSLESAFFAAAPRVAACGALVPRYVALQAELRAAVKAQSVRWDVTGVAARDRLYRALYGSRAAVEEVLLQHPAAAPGVVPGMLPDSAHWVTPSAQINGVTLHSGDILVSRGGYPTSALIARGSDYPGNFSHVALVHVDSATRAISVIEAHIEAGVKIATAAQYLADKKLRVLVLRPRADLAAVRTAPQLPHVAASAMLARARREHIAYDFAMDYADPTRLFCSEVASAAYRAQGVTLWMGISTISRPGLRRWLSAFGVEHLATQEPSDLEYDSQLQVVAEWRDAAALYADHVDNAVTDVMLEGADRGDALTFDWYTLPVARVMKAYSWAREQAGDVGPIPEGMPAAAALRNRRYGEVHAAHAAQLRTRAAQWATDSSYVPTYWTLLDLARRRTP